MRLQMRLQPTQKTVNNLKRFRSFNQPLFEKGFTLCDPTPIFRRHTTLEFPTLLMVVQYDNT